MVSNFKSNMNNNSDYLREYGFNPYQFTGSDCWIRDFYSRHVFYLQGCHRVLDLGDGRGFFLEFLK
jgi:hypothetical protein